MAVSQGACFMVELDREPTEDERAGIDWWNSLSEFARADWLRIAGSARPADAWTEYKRARENTLSS